MVEKADRKVDFTYSPEVIQTCIGFADDYHKTIVREDGSLNYNFDRRVTLRRTKVTEKESARSQSV